MQDWTLAQLLPGDRPRAHLAETIVTARITILPQAQRSAKGRIVLFRPNKNAERMQSGAARMLMPAPPAELFIRAVREVVEANQVGFLRDPAQHYTSNLGQHVMPQALHEQTLLARGSHEQLPLQWFATAVHGASASAEMASKPPSHLNIVKCMWQQELVPPLGKGALYIRPLLLGSGPLLGLGPAPSYTFVVYAAAVGAYFKVGGPVLSFLMLRKSSAFHQWMCSIVAG